jgi:hypothetical protein
MSLHGVGAAAAHRPQFAQSAQRSPNTQSAQRSPNTQNTQRGNRPAPTQPSTQGTGAASVASASDHQPPAHGVRRLIADGHFEGKNSYGPLTAKFGAPPPPLEATDPITETTLEAIQEAAVTDPLLNPEETPMIIERQPEILPPTPPPATNQPLLDIDALLMEELINDSSTVGEFVDQLTATTTPADGTAPPDILAA